MCRAAASSEFKNIIAFGGCAGFKGSPSRSKSFISVHYIDSSATFPHICTVQPSYSQGCIIALEWLHLTKVPTLVAIDETTVFIYKFDNSNLDLLQKIEVHSSKKNSINQ